MTRTNFDEVTDEGFIGQLVDAGCKFFMLVEYTPVTAGTEDWVLTQTQKEKMFLESATLSAKNTQALFIALPWDEDEIGGCLFSWTRFHPC